ncbi:AarF/UbiB family protein [Moorena sp. SIO3B2]|uniref:ABC1 kinase family protein n=1 Tax=Moorena sp. SIO3B2 TaxID=2607827 RepID=UPI0013CC5561|nr:AarF/UbiB family protein [Moorena sp. SIO3B2]NEP35713.1 AarF/ABC1/UbiB kinase family protein [Moorena sp. SIO3B2]
MIVRLRDINNYYLNLFLAAYNMIKKKDIPTPLIDNKQRKQVKIAENLEVRRFSTLYIIQRFIIYYLGIQRRRITNKPDIQKNANELRQIFEDLGGFWVKTGQLLALRTDILPDEICDQLIRLQYEAIGFPMAIVRSTIESELGAPMEKIFQDFDETPLAAASIGQVHRATLRSKRKNVPVIVKIQRPNLAEAFKRDLDLIKVVAKVLISFNFMSYLRLDEAVSELDKIFNEELDYRYEASNTRNMRKTLKQHKIYVPKIYNKYSKRRVLVMEYIDGVLASDYIKVLARDPVRASQWQDENDFDPKKAGETMFISLLRQVFEDNLYHGDLHPGNIIFLRRSKVAFIDMGSVGSLDRELRVTYNEYTNALSDGDFAKAANYILRLAVDIPRVNVPRVRAEMSSAIEVWSTKAQLKGIEYKEKSFGGATAEVSKVIARYGIPSNWTFLKVTRSFLTLDGALQYLLPEFDFFKTSRKYNRQSDRRALKQSLEPKSIRTSINQFFDTISEYNNLILPELRQRTIAFELTSNIFALLLVVGLRSLAYLLLITEAVVVYSFLYQHYFKAIEPIHTQWADEFVQQIPHLPYLEWIGIFILIGLSARTLLAGAKILERKDFPQ